MEMESIGGIFSTSRSYSHQTNRQYQYAKRTLVPLQAQVTHVLVNIESNFTLQRCYLSIMMTVRITVT